MLKLGEALKKRFTATLEEEVLDILMKPTTARTTNEEALVYKHLKDVTFFKDLGLKES